MTDEVRIVLPAQEDLRHIVHLVTGGLAARLDVTFESLEDLQVALSSVLACREDDDEIVVTVAVEERALRMTVGPFAGHDLDELGADGASFGLRRVLDTLCDGFEVTERDGATWVELTKRTATTAETAG
jgi:hypothetical protein